MSHRPVIAVTMGDPAGIGPEIVLRAAADPAVQAAASVVIIGDRGRLADAARITGVTVRLEEAVPLRPGETAPPRPGETMPPRPGETAPLRTGETAPLIDLANVPAGLPWGRLSPDAGRAAGQYVERAVAEARAGRVDAVATAPLQKEALWQGGYAYPGHTELLGALCGVADPLTMFQVRGMRIFFLSRHLSLRDAIARVTRGRIAALLPRIAAALQALDIAAPRIAVAALNPHAGEGGALGREDQDEIAPAVADARAAGVDAYGPVPADAVFAQALEGRYDAVLSLYHDQGHIAAKTVDFHGAVSVTLGLPFIRTSVDHGTAFDIAGTGRARAESMAAAIVVAADLVRRRAAVRVTSAGG